MHVANNPAARAAIHGDGANLHISTQPAIAMTCRHLKARRADRNKPLPDPESLGAEDRVVSQVGREAGWSAIESLVPIDHTGLHGRLEQQSSDSVMTFSSSLYGLLIPCGLETMTQKVAGFLSINAQNLVQ